MTLRAIILGLLLGLGIAGTTYFNDSVINQTMLIGDHLPISVFGAAMILLLVVNPLLRVGGRSWPLRGGEIGIIVAIGLASCGWPGSGFFRGFNTVSGLPAHWLKTKTDWQAVNVMSYVPGGAAELAPGQVQDWPALLGALGSPRDETQAAVASHQSPATRQLAERAMNDGRVDASERRRLLRAVNADLIEPTGEGALHRTLEAAGALPEAAHEAVARQAALIAEAEGLATPHADAGDVDDWRVGTLSREAAHWGRHANRAALVGVMGESVVLPAPRGQGVLVAGGRADPYVIDTLVQGRGAHQRLSLWELPWRAWWPPIRLWWSLALLMGLASLCLTLIVHPQWSRRELLPYPIARFVEESVERRPGAWLPEVARQRMFWVALIGLVGLHSINGLHAWFEQVPAVPLSFDFNALRELFPTASRVYGANTYFTPPLFLSVIAFSFFLTTSVSFSLGVSQALFMVLGTMMLMRGLPIEQTLAGSGGLNLLRFGAYLGVALMIGYTGRRYYLNVLVSAAGLPRAGDTPAYATWAARGLMVSTVACVAVMGSAGLDWFMAALLVLLVLLIYLVITRIVVETGAFFVQAVWLPVGVLTGLFGFEAIGPATYVVLAVASVMMVVDPREALMPYLANGLQIADRTANARPARVSKWLALMIVASLLVAGSATLYFQYNHGLNGADGWTKGSLPRMSFDKLSQNVSQAMAQGTIAPAAAVEPWDRLAAAQPERGSYRWALFGVALVIGCAVARLRLPWWPLHPVAFLVWGTYPITQFGFSFLLGWMIKSAVVRTSGASGYHHVKPLMIGVIAGELLAGLLWIGVGAAYYAVTGKPPPTYSIFPN